MITDIVINGTHYQIFPEGGTEGKVLGIVNGTLAWVDNDDGWGTF